MSAFVVSHQHISYMLRAAIAYGRLGGVDYNNERVTYANAEQVGRALLAENLASVNYRYNDTLTGADEYKFSMFHGPKEMNAVQVLKAISCYEYQSCEHPCWEASAARQFCEVLRSYSINHLPGYEQAAWEVI